MAENPIRVERLTGSGVTTRLGDLARLRITVFRDFPYLYDGSDEYEQRYLATYANRDGAVIVGVFVGDRLVGAASGLPARHEPDYVTGALADAGLDISAVFYFGESVLESAWRGTGIGVRFFEEREAHARGLPGTRHLVFCAVDRPVDHPRCPSGYVPLDGFWRNRGFRPLPDVSCAFSWQDLDEAEESPKLMRFWIKDIC